mgnify:CR=1 FL=1
MTFRLSIIATLSMCLFASTSTGEQTSSIRWNTHYGQAKRLAEAAKRPLLVVIEKSSRAEEQIDESLLAAALDQKAEVPQDREKFQLVRVDATTDYGKRVAQAFGVKNFPYTAVTDDDTKKIVYRKSGKMSSADWTLAFAKNASSKSLQPTIITERVVRRPVQEYTVVSRSPVTASPAVTTGEWVSGQPVSSPVNLQQMFAPQGYYQMPAEQCFT